MRKAIVALGVLCVGACAGRAPAPVAVVQPQDRYMDCTALTAEVHANTKRISELGSEESGKVAQNIAAGVAGLFIWPLWFAMDFQNAAGKEVAALQSRQQYLATIAEQRCGVGAPPMASSSPASSGQPVVVTPAVAPASSRLTNTIQQMIDCVDAEGSRVSVAGGSCPPPWKAAP